jgi:hypothetical protein
VAGRAPAAAVVATPVGLVAAAIVVAKKAQQQQHQQQVTAHLTAYAAPKTWSSSSSSTVKHRNISSSSSRTWVQAFVWCRSRSGRDGYGSCCSRCHMHLWAVSWFQLVACLAGIHTSAHALAGIGWTWSCGRCHMHLLGGESLGTQHRPGLQA